MVHPALYAVAMRTPRTERVAVRATSDHRDAPVFLRTSAIQNSSARPRDGYYAVRALDRIGMISTGPPLLAVGAGLLGAGLYLFQQANACRGFLCGIGEGIIGLSLLIVATPPLLIGVGLTGASLAPSAEVKPSTPGWRYMIMVRRP